MSNDSILSSFLKQFISSYEILPPKVPITIHQRALFAIWVLTTVYYFCHRYFVHVASKTENTEDSENKLQANNEKDVIIKIDTTTTKTPVTTTPKFQPVTLKEASLSIIIVGLIMMYYFLCDYLHYFPKSDRTYNRDLFIFLIFLLFAISLYFTSREVPGGGGKLLNRDQSEEWKGWMQVMFVWYHYFRAIETYNAVRLYIAAYVWMTGFGNFSFFYVRKDYSLRRVLKMLFRLNFLVVLTTFVLDNSYMLYYICAMHTFWFLSVYTMMRIFHQHNENKKVMVTKFIIYFCIVFIVFDVPGVAKIAFAPFSYLLNYNDSLHEWIFRSKLDHWATFIGMLCAYNHPHFEKALNFIDQHRLKKIILLGISTLLAVIIGIWYKYVFVLEKYDYNKLHQYTSFIPILTFLFLRNSTSWLRNRYLHLFAVLGKITLETYISQLHIYLQMNAEFILVYVPGYPLISFVTNSIIYLYLSNLLFHATLTINEYLFPSDTKQMWKHLASCITIIAVGYFIGMALSVF